MTTAATITEHTNWPTPGIKKGKFLAQSGYTTKFGWNTVVGVLLTVDDNDDAIVSGAISGGDVTIGLIDDQGAAITADTTGYYIAWGY